MNHAATTFPPRECLDRMAKHDVWHVTGCACRGGSGREEREWVVKGQVVKGQVVKGQVVKGQRRMDAMSTAWVLVLGGGG